MKRRGKPWPEIGKFITARCVEAPYSASAGTLTSPIDRARRVGGGIGHVPIVAFDERDDPMRYRWWVARRSNPTAA